jgi:hypothetical protein
MRNDKATVIYNKDEGFPRWGVMCPGRQTEWFGSPEQAKDQADSLNEAAKLKARKLARRAREDALRSVGLVKVRGAMGGTFWE